MEDRTPAGDPWTTLEGWAEYSEEAVDVRGYVRRIDVSGGTWVIEEPQGARWAPINLPEPFLVDGRGVVAAVRLRPDLLSAGMVGELVEILRIRDGSVPEADTPAEGEPGVGAPSVAQQGVPVEGAWRVVDHHRPGVSAMSDDRARRWRGREFRFSQGYAYSPGGECVDATYEVRRVSVDALLSGQFGVPVETLPPVAGLDDALVVEVRCGAASWSAVGQMLIILDDGHALAPWDGVFFELRRSG